MVSAKMSQDSREGVDCNIMRKSAQKTRQHLLAAAETIVSRDGVNYLTLDAVAKEAGVSKGGVLYHFSGKKALIEGMLERLFKAYEEMMESLYAAETEGPGRWLRAYIRSALEPIDPDPDLTSGLIAALASERELLAWAEPEWMKWEEMILNDGLPAHRAMLIKLAADGYWFGGIFSGQVLQEQDQRKQVLEELLKMTRI